MNWKDESQWAVANIIKKSPNSVCPRAAPIPVQGDANTASRDITATLDRPKLSRKPKSSISSRNWQLLKIRRPKYALSKRQSTTTSTLSKANCQPMSTAFPQICSTESPIHTSERRAASISSKNWSINNTTNSPPKKWFAWLNLESIIPLKNCKSAKF